MKIIDVRSEKEFNDGHLNGAINIDVSDIVNGKLPDFPKDTSILLYCASGSRSEFAKNILLSSGFTNVVNGGGYESLKTKRF